MSRMNRRHHKRQGFTLIELMLAMGFVGSLLVMIALIIMQIMGLYNRGLTIKEVNQVSRTVVRDMQQSISSVDAFTVRFQEEADSPQLKTPESLREAVAQNVDYYSNAAGGRLCTGSYSYVWNTGEALKTHNRRLFDFNEGSRASQVVDDSGNLHDIQFTSDGRPVRFIKTSDPGKKLCAEPESATATPNARDVGDSSDFTNVFGAGNNELVLYKFNIETRSDIDLNNTQSELTAASSFYYIQMTLGTQAGDENLVGDPNCNPPEGGGDYEYNDGEYCAINKIDFVARTGGIGR